MNPIANTIKKETYIKCKKCGTEVYFETRGNLTPCKCGAISIDGSKELVRVLGKPEDYEEIQK
jgi:ribosomal protein L37E